MAKILVANHVTLDGVMQSPARPDEDTRDGFAHGGWAAARNDELMAAKIGERMAGDRAFLFGRRTYEDFYAVWPNRPGNPFSEALTNTPKYVASRSLAEPLPWENSILLTGDAAEQVAKIKQQRDGTLTVFGSGELTGALIAADLVDEFLLIVHPLVLGNGRRLFGAGPYAELELIDAVATDAGVVIAAYRRPR
ncbi:MAG TPA: dihydrofolate reductase family protein [Solirubrobacteraceae bacterium]|jgi:dihydrofolate reductase|nr:dihydrofolate reductase family protein [Solirubrobacteraceae bacterium]